MPSAGAGSAASYAPAGRCCLVAGGSGLLAAAFAAGPAGADSTLGGFTVSGLAEAVTAQYEQPNFPLPATPSLEFDEGYASTTDNFGPSGTATASSLYPGQVVANAGPELALLVPGRPVAAGPGVAHAGHERVPAGPNTGSTDQPGVNMDASSTTNGNTASATLGDDAATAGSNGADPTQQAPSGSGNPLAGSSAIIGVGNMSATSSSLTPSTSADAQASATDIGDLHPRRLHHHRERHLDGHGHLGRDDREGHRVDGGAEHGHRRRAGDRRRQRDCRGGPERAARPPDLDRSTPSSASSASPCRSPTPTDKVAGPSASRTLDGLKITIDLKTLDSPINSCPRSCPHP